MSIRAVFSTCLRSSWTPRHPWRSCAAVTFAVFIGATLTSAALKPARVAGHVTGHRRTPLAGARITLSPVEPAEPLTETADVTGAFTFSDVAPGRYRVAVSYRELRGASSDPLLFESGESYTLDLPMAMSAEP